MTLLLGKLESLLLAQHFHSDPMINAIFIGLALGGVLIVLFIAVVLLCSPSAPPAAKPAPTKADGGNAAETTGSPPVSPRKSAAGTEVRKRNKATT